MSFASYSTMRPGAAALFCRQTLSLKFIYL
jgi:hypothetical protein